MVVKELARATKGKVRALCPCDHCQKRHRHGKDEMYKHLVQYGYMPEYVPNVNFDEFERDRSEVMRQRINGVEHDGIRDLQIGRASCRERVSSPV